MLPERSGRATITAPSDQKPLNRPVAAQWIRTGWSEESQNLVLFLHIKFEINKKEIRGYVALLMDIPSIDELRLLMTILSGTPHKVIFEFKNDRQGPACRRTLANACRPLRRPRPTTSASRFRVRH
jgi:hypothetical protein